MPNFSVNQTSDTINLPDNSNNMNNLPGENKPDEHIPPIEVPGRTDVPKDIPEKSAVNN
jgi:hypothetical protein